MTTIDYSIKDVEKLVKFDGKLKNVKTSRLTAPGENFLSLVLQVDFEVEKNGHSKTVSSVAKRLPLNNKSFSFFMSKNAMKAEIKWYSKVVPLLKEFAKDNGIKMNFYPEHYGSRYSLESTNLEVDSDSVLLLENLIPQGYQNDDRYIGFDLVASKAILKSLALFHALPIVMKINKPDLFQTLKSYLAKDGRKPPGGNGPPGSDGKRVPGQSTGPGGRTGPPPGGPNRDQMLLEEIQKFPELAPYISKIRPLLTKPWMGPDKKITNEPWNTIVHNDFWVNNIMINHKEEKDPLIKIVDFQMCEYGSYATDLIFFLLTSVQNDVAKESLDDLLGFYYEEFLSIFRKANVNLELSYADYLEEVRTIAQLEVAHALSFSMVIFGEKGTGVDVLVEEFDNHEQNVGMMRKINQYQKDKMIIMASEAIKRNWI